MTKHIPKILYKYRRCQEHSFENLRNKVVWCGTLDNYNDPYEGYTTIHFLPIYKEFLNMNTSGHYNEVLNRLNSEREVAAFAASELKMPFEQITRQISEQKKFQEEHNKSFRDRHRQDTAICSFAEDYDNRLMWSHYTNDYKGFCIGYETEQVKKFLYKVEYKNEIFDISNDIIKIMTQPEDAKFDNKKSKPNQMVIQKDSIWNYEKEWRLINPITEITIKNLNFNEDIKRNKGYTYPLEPSVIYLGTKISEEDKNQLMEIAKEQEITVNQMIMDENKYQLRYETIYKANKGDK